MLCVCWATPNFWENALIVEKTYNVFSLWMKVENIETIGFQLYFKIEHTVVI